MRVSLKLLSLLSLLPLPLFAQNNASSPNGCNYGFSPGTDTVIFTTPYTYAQVMSIIGSFRNITWSGSPYNTVTLNGTDNTVGTARTYNLDGAHVVETIEIYSKPPNGPYDEVHYLDLLTIPAYNLSVYADYDGTTVVETCGGLASTFNFTINFCSNNATLAAGLLHTLHLTDAQTVGVFLGGKNFTSCAALQGNATSSSSPLATSSSSAISSSSPSATSSSPTASSSSATSTGAAGRVSKSLLVGLLPVALVALAAL